MDRKNVEAVIRSMLGNPGDASKERMKIKNVARPDDPEPTSKKSTLTRTAEIKHKIVDEQETTMDKEKRLASLLGFSDSLIEAAKNISKKNDDKDDDKEDKKSPKAKDDDKDDNEDSDDDEAKLKGGKTKVDTNPKTKNPDMKEELTRKQKKHIDKDKDGRITKKDFDIMHKEDVEQVNELGDKTVKKLKLIGHHAGNDATAALDDVEGKRMDPVTADRYSKANEKQKRAYSLAQKITDKNAAKSKNEEVELSERNKENKFKKDLYVTKKGVEHATKNLGFSPKDHASMSSAFGHDKPTERDNMKALIKDYKRRGRAVTKEEVEEIDEISGQLAHDYKKGSLQSIANLATKEKQSETRDRKIVNRSTGIERADKAIEKDIAKRSAEQKKKIATEENEQVNELNQGVYSIMGRYSKKAADKVSSGEESPEKRAKGRLLSGMKRRGGTGGIPSAKVPAVQREEVEEIDELKKSTLANYIGGASQDKSFAAHDIGQINQRAASTGTSHSDRVERDKLNKRHGNRSAGIGLAANKLAGQHVKVPATEENETSGNPLVEAVKRIILNKGE